MHIRFEITVSTTAILAAVSVAGLTLYDMAKAVDKDMIIGDIRVLHKSGGKFWAYDRD